MTKRFLFKRLTGGRCNSPLYFLPVLLLGMWGCRTSTPNGQPSAVEPSRVDTELILNNAILEQSNKRENTVWKIKADKIVYSEDQKTATLDKVVGNLLQNGKLIFQISAKTGKVKNNGNVIVLNDNIVAKDPRNEGIIKSEMVEWRPQENLLLIQDGLNGIHPNLNVTAAGGKYFTNLEKLEIIDDVVATTEQPPLQLKSDRLVWNLAQNQVNSPGAVNIVRYDQQEQVTDRLVSDRASFDLTTQIATLDGNIELISLQPNLQAATESLTWNYQTRTGKTEQPVQIIDRDRQIDITGNQGEINLQQQIAKLTGGVRGINKQKSSQLYARQLTWNIDTEEVEAMGNIVYEQADPQARLTGEKAVGTLANNNIVVTSDGQKQVTTTIDNK